VATRTRALLGILLLPWLLGCADPGVPLSEAIPSEFQTWAKERGDDETYVVHGHSPYAVQVSHPGEGRRLHGPQTYLARVRASQPGAAEIELLLQGWQPELAPTAGAYRVFALPADYRRSDWRLLRAEPPLAEGALRPDGEGQVRAKITVPREAGVPSRYLVTTLFETEAGLLYPGPREVSLPRPALETSDPGEAPDQD